MDTEVAFNNVMCTDDIEGMKNMARFERSLSEYNGPDFTTLDERIQTSVTEYLEGYGINEHLAAFVECMSLDKDQRLYMRWLQNVQNFVNKWTDDEEEWDENDNMFTPRKERKSKNREKSDDEDEDKWNMPYDI